MFHRTIAALALIVLAPLSVDAQVAARTPIPSDAAVARHGLVRRWYGLAPIDGVREKVQSVMVVGDQVHVQTNQSRIHVMHGESGKLLWTAQLGRPGTGQVGSAANSNSVFVVSGTHLYRLNRDTGVATWSIRLPQVPNAAPAADEERVLISTVNGRLYVYNVDTNEVIWFYQTDKPLSVPAVFLDERIACASQDGKLYVFQVSSRNPTLRYQTDAPVSAPLAVWGRLALVPSRDYNVYAADVRNGQTKWRYTSGSEIHRPLTVIENEVYVSPDEYGLHVLNAATESKDGERIWWYPHAEDFVAASARRVYASDRYGQLLILDRATGRLLGTWDTHDFDFRVRNDSNDRLYLATQAGLVVCLHERENQEPVIHKKVTAEPAKPAEEAAEMP
jgi:outer membrane protein assembly factor BamB